MNLNNSRELFKKAKKVMPGGVNSPVRSFKSVGLNPVFIKKAKGSRIIDIDGNKYIDYVCSWGPMILGHAHPFIIYEIKKAVADGTSYGAVTAREVELAETICEAFSSVEMLRMVSSGTEAAMSAIRLARGYTGRDKILKFEGCYHGHADGLLVRAGSGALTTGIPDSAGVPSDYAKNTIIANYNNCEGLEVVFKKFGKELAAVIVEPVAGNMGLVLPDKKFLNLLRNLTFKYGVLLIFDEVITGFRLKYGGAQAYYGIDADITVLGKIIGGGMPLGAYGAGRKIMKNVSPLGPVYQAGTLSGNPVAMAAGIATLKLLRDNQSIYEEIANKAQVLKEAYIAAGQKYGISLKVNSIASMLCVFFTQNDVVDYKSALGSDTNKFSKYFSNMLKEGIYIPPSQFETLFISYAHSISDIKKTIIAINNSMKGLS
ncbi:MAG: glutamate-1-semialdehyde 2,1-aminomutase [Candidatus Humimicrobiaceae bacterium]